MPALLYGDLLATWAGSTGGPDVEWSIGAGRAPVSRLVEFRGPEGHVQACHPPWAPPLPPALRRRHSFNFGQLGSGCALWTLRGLAAGEARGFLGHRTETRGGALAGEGRAQERSLFHTGHDLRASPQNPGGRLWPRPGSGRDGVQPEEAALRRSRPWAPGGHGDRAASGPGPAVRIAARRFFFANYETRTIREGGGAGGVCDGSDGDTPGAWQRQRGEDGGGKDDPVHGTPATTKFTSKHTSAAENLRRSSRTELGLQAAPRPPTAPPRSTGLPELPVVDPSPDVQRNPLRTPTGAVRR
ncbi:hypothetical protein J1605_009195 [Eschrichtius robustus]|uniref:Uncharacterized protein n=1 Tax=Eschrichtius robustus TaxID=9764 RepID=A0AB34GXW6_ESCRO|nr:hypothetical protein J1605_009195 [Eschrichtius robustus]